MRLLEFGNRYMPINKISAIYNDSYVLNLETDNGNIVREFCNDEEEAQERLAEILSLIEKEGGE